MELSATEETFKLNAKISYLNLIGNLGPLIGLLGTVTGMIGAFQVIATLKSPTPKDLAEGVYESLVNTTMGLFIALVFLDRVFISQEQGPAPHAHGERDRPRRPEAHFTAH